MRVSTVEEMRNLDRRASEEYGVAEDLLMENAGLAAYSAILRETGVAGKRFVVFCGAGNNGGDGLVVARKLHSNGGQVRAVLLGDRSKFKGAARRNLEIAEKMPFELQTLTEAGDCKSQLESSEIVVDAIFGTGLSRDIGGLYKKVIEAINDGPQPVFSLDIPSGINGNTGQEMGTAVRADHTIAFGLPKLGNLLYPGFEFGGKLHVSHISFPPELYNTETLQICTNDPVQLPVRSPNLHKGSAGKALFIAGAASYVGAPYLSAKAFLKAGGGVSVLATPEKVAATIGNKGSELVFRPQKATAAGSLSLANRNSLLELAESVDFIVMGPGLSLDEETQSLVRELAAEISKPLLIDGDGLTAVAADSSCLSGRKATTILTPHLGEMSRLTGKRTGEITQKQVEILQETSARLKASVVLKGAHSLIGFPAGRVYINLSGNAGMATAGSGDVLTGTIAAMFALGFDLETATRMGVFIHGLAGDLAALKVGQDGLVAGDILNALPSAMKTIREKFKEVSSNDYGKINLL